MGSVHRALNRMGAVASRTLSVAGPSDLSDVVFRIVDQTRYTEVLDLLYTNFHTDEPMSRALKIFDGTNRIPEADEYTLRALSENLSLMAVDSLTNKLLGVCVNGLVRKTDFPLSSQQVAGEVQNPGFRQILAVMATVHQRAGDIWAKVEGDIMFDIKMVTTDKNNRRSGLGTDLLRRSVQLAASLGYKAIKTEATGLYSRKAFERLGFEAVSEVLYSEYEAEGERIFEKIKNHRGTSFMIKKNPEIHLTAEMKI